MGQSIGELFVSLGFELDESKLKSFNNGLNDAYGTILKVAGAAGLATGFYEIAKGAGNNAVALRDLNSELGVNIKYAQDFASIWKTVNPTADINEGLKITANMANYASQAKQGKGGSEYGLFGGSAADFINPLTGQFDADIATRNMVERLRTGLPMALATFGGDKTKVSQLLQAITGSSDMMNVLNATKEQIDEANKLRDITEKNNEDTIKAAEGISHLQQMWDNFTNHVMASIAPMINAVYKKGVVGAYGDFIDTANERGRIRHIIGWNSTDEEVDAYIAAHKASGSNGSTSVGIGAHNPGNLQPGGKEAVYQNDDAGLAAMAENLRRYNRIGWNTIDDIIDHWSPANGKGNSAESTANYKAALEKALSVGGAQHLNLNDPAILSQIMPAMIKFEQGKDPYSSDQIAKAAGGDTTNNVSIKVEGSADPEEVARRVHQRFIDVTYPSINNGPY